jgi:hypothetical protein
MIGSRSMRSLRQDARGSVALEGLIAFAPLWLGFASLCQLSDLYVHQLLVGRAAAVAARAAVVVLPDDGAHYTDPDNRSLHRFVGERRASIERAAHAVLAASPSLTPVSVSVSGELSEDSLATTRVVADYSCLPLVFAVGCGSRRVRRLEGSVALPYHYAGYRYASRD